MWFLTSQCGLPHRTLLCAFQGGAAHPTTLNETFDAEKDEEARSCSAETVGSDQSKVLKKVGPYQLEVGAQITPLFFGVK